MKKIMSLLVVFALLATMLVSTAFAAESATVKVAEVAGKPGEEVTIDVSISGNPGFAAAKFVVEYDDALTLVSINTEGKLMAGGANNPEKGIVNTASAENITADGVLFSVTFKVAADIDGKLPVSVKVEKLANTAQENVAYTVVDGGVILPCICVFGGEETIVWNWFETKKGWDCEVYYVCPKCGEKISVPCTVNGEVTKQPTADEKGEAVYTATAVIEGQTYTNSKTVELEKLPAPETADGMVVGLYVTMALLAAAGVVVLKKKVA